MIAFSTPVERLVPRRQPAGRCASAAREPGTFDVDAVVNAAGLGAQALAARDRRLSAGTRAAAGARAGQLFRLRGPPRVLAADLSGAAIDGGLGTHVTLDLAGRMRFGPDVEWIERRTTRSIPRARHSFYDSIRSYWPGLPDDSLMPDYAGIRPKLTGPGEPAADFMIEGPAQHGLPGLVHLFGIESPGLTSALSLAEDVIARLDRA